MSQVVKKVHSTSHHRNGVGGAPFGVVLFTHSSQRRFVGIVFPEKGYTAVLELPKLTAMDIEFLSNSWRGDRFEPELIAALEADGNSPYPEPEDEPAEKEYEVALAVHEYLSVKVKARNEAEANGKAELAWAEGNYEEMQGSDIEVTGVRELR